MIITVQVVEDRGKPENENATDSMVKNTRYNMKY
jgi:hypothetical protein